MLDKLEIDLYECEVKNQTFEDDEDVTRCFFKGGSE